MSTFASFHLLSQRSILSLLAIATISTATRAQNLPGAISHWPLDDGANPTVDVVGGHNGTVVGATFNSDVPPMPGCGQDLMFAGTDYVSVHNTPALSFAPGTAMSIALWIKETTDQPTVHYLGKRSGCDGGNVGINYQIARDPTYGIQFASKNGGILGTGVGVALDQWRHIAVTYDGTANLTIYIDGASAAASSSYTLGGVNNADLLLGGSGSCGGNLIGLIDEVWIFNRQLSDTEVHLLSENNPGTYCTAKVNSLGCTPAMVPGGSSPSLSGPDDFYVVADYVLSHKTGILFWSTSGPANIPFHNGFRCVAAPFVRTQAMTSGGNPPPTDCSGIYRFFFSHQYMASHNVVAGSSIYAQYWTRDPGFPFPDNVGLTNAMQFVVCP